MSKLILIFSLVFCLSACSSIDTQDPSQRLVFQYSTAKFIERSDEPKERATRIIEEIDMVRAFIDFQGAPLTELKERIVQRALDRGLTPADMILVNGLIAEVEIRIAKYMDDGIIDEDETMRINAVLNLIEQAAAVYL